MKTATFEPSYLKLYETGELKERVEKAISMLYKKGFCKTGRDVYVASYFPHKGEEFPIRGYYGSGTVFFSFCNMKCVYCQNYDISQLGEGKKVNSEQLSEIMIDLQKQGCHNINWVSPSHIVSQLLKALYLAVQKGLRIPIVYNTSSYDSIKSLKLLDGIVDIIKEMYRQVGDLKVDDRGIAYKGVLVRHLVLPNDISNTKEVLEFLRSVSPNIHVNVMSQYHPYFKAFDYSELNRMITSKEYFDALNYTEKLGLNLVKD